MKFIDEYRDKAVVLQIIKAISFISKKEVRLMEVCGGHTMAIQKFGIPSLLPPTIKLLSGPGCPVCVSSRKYIDQAVAYSRLKNTIITTYGDLIRVPGSSSTLEKEKAEGADIRIVYSVLDSLVIARNNPDRNIVFLAIGFETTSPGNAAAIQTAYNENLKNFFVYSSHKIMPPAMKALIDEGIRIDGYIAPGHVSTITGHEIYQSIPESYGVGCVISGFEPLDLLQSIYMLVKQVEENRPQVEIQYKRAVKPEGNLKAKQIMWDVFKTRPDWWRGLGILDGSGLTLNEKYARIDAEKMLSVDVETTKEDIGCICGEILKGLMSPKECKLFATACTPADPVGACMVSSEGACQAFYKYNRD